MSVEVVLAYGITFGILIMSIVYTVVKYIYEKELYYLIYSFMQVFSLIYILGHSELFNILNIVQELALLLASLFAIVFSFSYSKGRVFPLVKTKKELFIYTFLIIIILATSLYHYVLFEYLPYTIIYALIFFSLIFNIEDEFRSKSVYVIGWTLVCLLLYFTNFKTLYSQKGYLDLVLIAFAIEALLFTLSVAYSYKSMQSEKKNFKNMLLQQSRIAKAGEMIGNITHQFRQPLNNISYILMNINKSYQKDKLDKKYLDKKIEQAVSQLEYMSSTIDDFKDFYEPSKHKDTFLVKEAISQALTILSASIKQQRINLDVVLGDSEDIKVYGIKNELSQVILNLITNSIEALKSIEEPKILIKVTSNSAEVKIEVKDNGCGIKDINSIFKPYFTTKKKGFGIGLALIKTLIEDSFNGKIEVDSSKEGSSFTLFLEKSI